MHFLAWVDAAYTPSKLPLFKREEEMMLIIILHTHWWMVTNDGVNMADELHMCAIM